MSVVKRGNGKSPINGSFNGTVRNLFVNMTDFKVPRIITPEGKHFNKPDDQHPGSTVGQWPGSVLLRALL